jgi:hypothetical protein
MKQFLLLLLCILLRPSAGAQDMAAFFIGMPDDYVPQLEDAWRKDLVDLYRAGKPATLENTMNGRSTLLKLTQDYMFLQTTERSTLEMKFLPLINQTHIVCVVTTVSAPVSDSRVAFYTTDWKLLNVSELWLPPKSEWYIRKDIDRQDETFLEAVSHLDMNLIHCRLSADSLTLSVEYVTPQYLSAEEREKVTPFLMDSPKVYWWRAGRFEE